MKKKKEENERRNPMDNCIFCASITNSILNSTQLIVHVRRRRFRARRRFIRSSWSEQQRRRTIYMWEKQEASNRKETERRKKIVTFVFIQPLRDVSIDRLLAKQNWLLKMKVMDFQLLIISSILIRGEGEVGESPYHYNLRNKSAARENLSL